MHINVSQKIYLRLFNPVHTHTNIYVVYTCNIMYLLIQCIFQLHTVYMIYIYVIYINLMAESEEELKSLQMKVKEESVKADLKLSIQKMKITASGTITSWQIDREKVETVTDFIFLGSKITADGDCSQEIKRHLLLGRKTTTNLDRVLKSRDITLPTKVCLVSYGFSSSHVWM